MLKKSFLLLFIFIYCGNSETLEANTNIIITDEALNSVSSNSSMDTTTTTLFNQFPVSSILKLSPTGDDTTTTVPQRIIEETTTTTIDYVSLCKRNINEVYKIKNLFQPAKDSFIKVLNEYNDSGQDSLNVDVKIAAREFYALVEEILDLQKILSTPNLESIYSDYYFAVNEGILSVKLLSAEVLLFTSISDYYNSEERVQDMVKVFESIDPWIDRIDTLPKCSSSNY